MNFFISFNFIMLYSIASFSQNTVGDVSTSREVVSSSVLNENGKKAAEVVQPYEDFINKNKNPNLAKAAKATVQIISKCSIEKNKNGFRVYNGKAPFCGSKHPLSKYGPPDGRSIPDGQSYIGADKGARCASKPCSGVLLENQSTIATSAHCAHGMTPKELCENFVFVFNRTEGLQDKNGGQNFSKDEVFECDNGIKSDTTTTQKNFNLHSDEASKDHAFFNLTRSVPKKTAEAVKLRHTPSKGENLYAVGHPYGGPRTVSTLKGSKTTGNSNNNYSYIQARGYAYGGNSGGPLLDSNGQLVGILSSTDDNEHGAPAVREAMVEPEGGIPPLCRTQKSNDLIVESIGIGTEFKKAFERANGPSLYRPDVNKNSTQSSSDSAE